MVQSLEEKILNPKLGKPKVGNVLDACSDQAGRKLARKQGARIPVQRARQPQLPLLVPHESMGFILERRIMKSEIFYEFLNISILATDSIFLETPRRPQKTKLHLQIGYESFVGHQFAMSLLDESNEMPEKLTKLWHFSKATNGKFALCCQAI